MKNKILQRLCIITLGLFSLQSCVDPYHLESENFEEILVVEGTITNEMKQQKIKVSKSYRLEESGPQKVSNANVFVTDSDGNQFDFNFDVADSTYVSENNFAAQPGKAYTLNINSNGKSYTSTPEILTTENQIQEVTASVITKNNGDKGIKIGANSFDPTRSSNYYRFEYEETFKVVAPYWSTFDLNYDDSLFVFYLTDRVGTAQICYPTEKSNSIILTSTSDLSEDRVSDFEVNFIKERDYKLAHRYSILVKQYVQNLAAHTFYNTLKELSAAGGVLSQNQPGFFYGNLKSTSSSGEKIIGFFEVSSVSQKRIFINYSDFFTGSPNPYITECELKTYNLDTFDFTTFVLILETNEVKYYSQDPPVYTMASRICSDCSLISTNTTIPSFWE